MKMIKLNNEVFVMSTEISRIEITQIGLRIMTKQGEKFWIDPDDEGSVYEICDRLLQEIEDANNCQR